eukprot:2421517-Rhodomonas_salina.1
MLLHANVPALFWDYAVEFAAFLENTTHPFQPGSASIPWEAFHGAQPSVWQLRPFSCYAIAHKGKSESLTGSGVRGAVLRCSLTWEWQTATKPTS